MVSHLRLCAALTPLLLCVLLAVPAIALYWLGTKIAGPQPPLK